MPSISTQEHRPPSASGTSAGSSHSEEPPRCQSSDTRQEQFKFCYRSRTRKVYMRRQFQQPCEPAAAGALVAYTSIRLQENVCEFSCGDGQETSNSTTGASTTSASTTTFVVEKSEESAGRSSASPKASWEGHSQHSTRMKRDVSSPPVVLAGVARTMREEDGTGNGIRPEAEAAAATADVGLPQLRLRKTRVLKDFVSSSTSQYEWSAFYPTVPYPEVYEQLDRIEHLGEVEVIPTGSEGETLWAIQIVPPSACFPLKL